MANSPEIASTGNCIVLNFESLESALQLLSPWRGGRHRAEAVRQISRALAAVGLDVEVRVKGKAFAQLVSGQLQGPLLTLLGE